MRRRCPRIRWPQVLYQSNDFNPYCALPELGGGVGGVTGGTTGLVVGITVSCFFRVGNGLSPGMEGTGATLDALVGKLGPTGTGRW